MPKTPELAPIPSSITNNGVQEPPQKRRRIDITSESVQSPLQRQININNINNINNMNHINHVNHIQPILNPQSIITQIPQQPIFQQMTAQNLPNNIMMPNIQNIQNVQNIPCKFIPKPAHDGKVMISLSPISPDSSVQVSSSPHIFPPQIMPHRVISSPQVIPTQIVSHQLIQTQPQPQQITTSQSMNFSETAETKQREKNLNVLNQNGDKNNVFQLSQLSLLQLVLLRLL